MKNKSIYIYIYIYIYSYSQVIGSINPSQMGGLLSGWWYTYPSEKYEFVNGKDDNPLWKIKFMFETTNQYSYGLENYT